MRHTATDSGSIDSALLAPPLRRPALALTLLATCGFVGLAVRYRGDSGLGALDSVFEGAVAGMDLEFACAATCPPGTSESLELLLMVADPVVLIVLVALVASLAVVLGRLAGAALAVAGPLAVVIATTVLKPVVGRTFGDELAFPSGHTAVATSLGLVLGILVVSRLRLGRVGAVVVLLGAALALGGPVAVALIALRIHYPTDTLGGLLLAVAVVIPAAFLVDQAAGRLSV